ncbi:right-handed parallel beta-helix repeat-containing protein [Bacteroidales bacterium OttesenSCG-928-B11]|nr:right-handed parallel beta-helix repeat-containing protein [Bacteroidales bacterium OttesenSCG-928-E04]MDL2308221.1 right-handed parallel beta-helix repeat-containing protein [Bacteroidales bacterium OttesenSCG-928-C03]MDL2311521.1 right-handed parallel beta-helix repeat-containing protein [Bacteroidales bacterium OttesenSCG-928-B11]MDL2325660.1 right-handed parallel beta-helix repeat-containing protein [Bacteroidales bacterium OttesenSCG-928-A14]
MQKASLKNTYTYLLPFLFLFIIIFQNSACKSPDTIENAKLKFSKSIITFDTVFTTVGSVTERFTVQNPYNFEVTTDIYLAGGDRSQFSINVDGLSGHSFRDVTIPAKDSIFIFVKVNVNPNDANAPFLLEDSIIFRNGSNKQQMNLVAYGQNANFIVADSELGASGLRYKIVAREGQTVTWTKERPYVIYGWAVVDSLGKLIIEPGTEIYVHNGGGLWVYRHGNIEVNGTLEDPVSFQSDRRDAYVTNNGALWNRIWINESNHNNIINYAIIKDAYIGVQVDVLEEFLAGKTTIQNTIIKNNAGWGILGRAANIDIINCEISQSWQYAIECAIGNYSLKHVTVANSATGRKTPSLWISNNYIYSDGYSNINMIGNTNFTAQNCIFTGNMADELGSSVADGATFTHLFENCLIKSKENKLQNFTQCLFNKDVKFEDFAKGDFRLTVESPAINAGKNIGISNDIQGKSRDENPDIGAYEY